ncbi:hypothetical protein GDO86_015750 [Hymenochirus boettgeri]|uniref:Uncharacterized protein n=1 Tax=Hymenochirus boettgeri TaxID=247094 RepID=A0A8T2K2N3_9PIPI|nr:hypothetical protein GDO86_015750 [Hymenochirus boettgeri]
MVCNRLTGTLYLAVFISIVCYIFIWKRRLRKMNMPPGPPPLPLLGNIPHLSFTKMPQSLLKVSYVDCILLHNRLCISVCHIIHKAP